MQNDANNPKATSSRKEMRRQLHTREAEYRFVGRIQHRNSVALNLAFLMLMINPASAGFWYEDFADGNLNDSGIEWRYNRLWEQEYSNSSDGILSTATLSCCGAGGGPNWDDTRRGWSIRTQARLLQDHGFFGVGTQLDPLSKDATWNLVAANGMAAMGSGLRDDSPVERIETSLRPFDEDVIVQLETLDGVMRMWAWHDGDQPAEDIAPMLEEDFDLYDALPIFWNRSPDGTSSAVFRWIAISTEHMPVNMELPATDLIGDFSGNEILDVSDIDTLANAIQAGKSNQPFDLTQNGIVDPDDLAYWVTHIKQTWIGDANLDGEFNSGDFVGVFQAGKYETGEAATWSHGDWNADGVFDSSDFVTAFQGGGYERGPRASVAAVPEPSAAILLMSGLVGIARIRRHRTRTSDSELRNTVH